MTSDQPWFEQDSFWHTFEQFLFPDERFAISPEQCDQFLALTETGPGAAVLDLCCGPGRHSLELARRGFKVTGVDRTRAYLRRAGEAAARENLDVEFILEDMHSFCRPASFDLAINLFTSFGYSEDPHDDERVLAHLFESLRPGGALVMELMGKEVIARIFKVSNWSREQDGTLFLEERSLGGDWERMRNRWTLVRDGQVSEHRFDHRLFSAAELKGLLRAAGFREAAAYGSLSGDPYDQTAKRLVVMARK